MLGIAVAAIASVSAISWETTLLDLGEVKSGESIEISFDFTNESENEVQILSAKGSCGCTNVSYPEEPISAGETASITASFKSSKEGIFKKHIKVQTSESEELTYLYFKGEVVN